MSSSVIRKYLEKKKKDINNYSKCLESIITVETNNLWKSKKEFSDLAKGVIDVYVNKFYFKNNEHRDNPVAYSNDNINNVIGSLVEYCKNTNNGQLIQMHKNETFLMAVIICTACYVDISSNVVDGDYRGLKDKLRYILEHLAKTPVLKVKIKASDLDKLFSLVKTNCSNEIKFFKLFESDISYNQYKLLSKEENMYSVSYYYKIDGLAEYDGAMVKNINRQYIDKYLNISYELLVVKLLRDLISNEEIGTYVVPVTETALKKMSTFRVLDDEFIKQYIKIMVKYDDYQGFKSYIEKIEKNGFQFIYEYIGTGEVSPNTFLRNLNILVNDKFLKSNEEKLYSWRSQGIKFIVKNVEEDVR